MKAWTEAVSTWPDKKRVDLLDYLARATHQWQSGRRSITFGSDDYMRNEFRIALVQQVLRVSLVVDDSDVARLLDTFATHGRWGNVNLLSWPIGMLLRHIERQHKAKPVSDGLRATLIATRITVNGSTNYSSEKERLKLIDRINSILAGPAGEGEVHPVLIKGDDPFVPEVNLSLIHISEPTRPY